MVRSPSFDSSGMKKGAWSEEEDNKLKAYIHRYGHWNWRLLPKYAGLARCGKSCRLRWVNYLKPGLKHGNFTKEEGNLIIELHAKLGNKWSIIASKLPGRTDNEVKNYWHTHVKKCNKSQKEASNDVISPSQEHSSETTSCLVTDHKELTISEVLSETSVQTNSQDLKASLHSIGSNSVDSLITNNILESCFLDDSFLDDIIFDGQNINLQPMGRFYKFASFPEINYNEVSSTTSVGEWQGDFWTELFQLDEYFEKATYM